MSVHLRQIKPAAAPTTRDEREREPMIELGQLRHFVRVVELGSIAAAAQASGIAASAVSQQIARLEGELATRLLTRTNAGAVPTDAGLAFLRQAQLTLRHAADAVHAAQERRLAGHVSLGFPPSTAAVLGLPLLRAMRERYPEVKLHLVEAPSADVATMLQTRKLDLAVVFRTEAARRWTLAPLLDEALFVVARPGLPGVPEGEQASVAALAGVPLVLPSALHGLRALVNALFQRAKVRPLMLAEIDGLSLLMDAVRAGMAATIQPGAVLAREDIGALRVVRLADPDARRQSVLAAISDEELSPAALGARVVLADVARQLVRDGRWPGATPHAAEVSG